MSRWLVGSSSRSRSGSRHQRLAQERAATPSARQLAHRPIGRQRQPGDDRARPSARAASRHALRARAAARPSRPSASSSASRPRHRGVVILRDEVAELAEPAATSSKTDRSPDAGDVLIQPRDAQRRAPARSCRRRAALSPEMTSQQADLPEPFRPMSAMRSPVRCADRRLRRAAGDRTRARPNQG